MSYSHDHIAQVLNRSADDIAEAAGLPDEGARDALNLLVNLAMRRLDEPNVAVTTVILDSYEASPDEVLDWLTR